MKLDIRSFIISASIFLGISACLVVSSTALAQNQNPKKTEEAASNVNPPPPATSGQLVSIDFNNVDIGVFIKFISDLTKKNFIVDDKVRGKVTIISPGKITVAEAYRVFESVLEVYGFSAVPSGEITKIVPSPEARTKSIKTRLEEETNISGDMVVTQIIPLRYADPNEVKNLFTPLISRSSIIQAYTPTNTLIVTDVNSNIQRLLRILKAIDITGVGQQIAIIPVENAAAAKLVTTLESIFKSNARGKPPAGGQKEITFVADERTNSIVALASEGDIDNIRQLVKSLDKETPRGQGNINVYYLEYASAEDVVKVLQDIPQKSGTETGKEGGKPTTPVVSGKTRITADKATNSLIIMADTEDYLVLESIIKKLDIPRAMVYIEALIMEVNALKDFRLGTEWSIGDDTSIHGKDAIYGGGFKPNDPLINYDSTASAASGALVPVLPSGMSLGIFGEALKISGVTFPSISALIQAYKNDTDARILSTPQILTTDNQEAKIYVGKNVPFQTTATASTTGTTIYNSYEYRDVGKTLKITPQISKDRMVRLILALEVTDLQSTTDNRPTTLKRTVETTVICRDGNTVVLGGLIDDKEGETVTKVPCLGEIPGFGYLFRNDSKAFEKSNLYVFLTPRVIQNPEEASKVSAIKRREIDSLREEKIDLNNTDQYHSPQDLKIPGPDIQQPSPPQPSGDISPSSLMDKKAEEEVAALESRAKAMDPESAASVPVQQPPSIDSQAAMATPKGNSNGGSYYAGESGGTRKSLPHTPEAQPQHAPAIAAGGQSAAAGSMSGKGLRPAESPAGTDANRGSTMRSNDIVQNTSDIKGYTLQVASVQTTQQADQLIRQLTAKGYAAYTVRSDVAGKVWYRIRIGYFGQQAEAQSIINQLRSDQFDPILIKL